MKKNTDQLWIKLKDGFTEVMIVPDGFIIRSSGETSTGHGTESMVFCPCKGFSILEKWLDRNIWKGSSDDKSTQEQAYFAKNILQQE